MAYRGIIRFFSAQSRLSSARSATVYCTAEAHLPRASGLTAWLFLAMVTLVSGFASLHAADSVVNLTAPLTQAYEADPARFGLLQITRSNALDPAPLSVRIDIMPASAQLGVNFDLFLDPASIATGAGFAFSGAGPYGSAFDVTFPTGVSSIWVDVEAIDDGLAIPGLAANFQLTSGQPGVVVGADQVESIEIIDSTVVLQAVGLNKIIRETVPAELNPVAQARNFGTAQLLFASSAAPFTGRLVEAMISGSAVLGSDFSVTYRIGTSQVVNILSAVAFPVVPVFPNAYRRSTEYGAGNINAIPQVDGASGLTIAGDFPAGTARTTTTAFAVDAYVVPAGGVKVNLTVAGVTVTSWVEAVLPDGRMLISSTVPAIPLPIRQGAVVQLNYDVIVPGTGGSPATTTHVNVRTTVNEPMLYPRGSTSISITQNSGLQVGDVFIINGEIKRVTFASATLAATADTGPANFWIAFAPALGAPLYRTSDLTLTTHWNANFASTGNRISWFIPALPFTVPELAPGIPNGVTVPANVPLGDFGDHIDFLFAPIDDNLIEGEKSLTFTAIATGSTNGYTLGDPQEVNFRVGDNDVSASINVQSSPQVPGVNGALRIKLSSAFTLTNVTVPFTVRRNPGDAVYGVDYTIDGASIDSAGNVTGSIVFATGQQSVILPVRVLRTAPVGTPLPIKVSLNDSFDYVLAGTSGGSAGSNAATLNISDHSTVPTPVPPTPVVPDPNNQSESNGSGCGAGSGIAFVLLCAWLTLARFRLRNR